MHEFLKIKLNDIKSFVWQILMEGFQGVESFFVFWLLEKLQTKALAQVPIDKKGCERHGALLLGERGNILPSGFESRVGPTKPGILNLLFLSAGGCGFELEPSLRILSCSKQNQIRNSDQTNLRKWT